MPGQPAGIEPIRRVAIAGTGAWGTTLAILFADRGAETTLLTRSQEEAGALCSRRENARFLPGVHLPRSLTIISDVTASIDGADLVVFAVPAQRLRENIERLAMRLPAKAILLCAAKGIEVTSGLRMSEVIAELLGTERGRSLSLSGPNLSGEIVRGLPAASVIAGPPDLLGAALKVQLWLSSERLRLYTSSDQAGVEIGGAMKNVIAIACGICDGLGYGHNARAGLITRGLAEMTRLAVAAGGRAETLAGLTGLGDLVATVASSSSRNYSLGLALGRGETLEAIRGGSVHIAEGVPTAEAAIRLAARLGVELPVTEQLREVFTVRRSPRQAAAALMARAPSIES
jgi:glycerol-3-phosphate dehydrogenase (NAD(P)+)